MLNNEGIPISEQSLRMLGIEKKPAFCIHDETVFWFGFQGPFLELKEEKWYPVDTLKDINGEPVDAEMLRESEFREQPAAFLSDKQLTFLKSQKK